MFFFTSTVVLLAIVLPYDALTALSVTMVLFALQKQCAMSFSYSAMMLLSCNWIANHGVYAVRTIILLTVINYSLCVCARVSKFWLRKWNHAEWRSAGFGHRTLSKASHTHTKSFTQNKTFDLHLNPLLLTLCISSISSH